MLSLMDIEYELLRVVDFTELINEFIATVKARKQPFEKVKT
jgi:hypothetical protein